MKIFFVLIVSFLCLNSSVECLFGFDSLQDYVDSFIDRTKIKIEGKISLSNSSIGKIWSMFKSNYGRIYSSFEEEKERLRIFRHHLKFIIKSNLDRFKTYRLEVNEFADWTVDEFDQWKKGLNIPSITRKRRNLRKISFREIFRRRRRQRKRFFRDWFTNLFSHQEKPSDKTDIFDWRRQKVVSNVKNQYRCGCCYALSTATILESLYALKRNTSEIIEFSAQQITDCSSEGNNGCRGGSFPPSVRYISSRNGKFATEKSYPFVGKKQNCRENGFDEISLGRIEYQPIEQGNEEKLEKALIEHGPIFIGVDAESRHFMFYRGGILTVKRCPTAKAEMDHAMVVVGHGFDPVTKTSYWNIKNSWGTRWGENGYLRLAKDQGNMCGVATMAYYAKLV